MLDFKTCKRILTSNDESYTDEEIVKISELLWQLAVINTEIFFQAQNETINETRNSNPPSELG
jgi:hypothetical protein